MATVAILLAPGFEDAELEVPCDALRDAGHRVIFVGTESGQQLEGRNGEASVSADVAARDVEVDELDALLLVGGDDIEALDPLETTSALVLEAVDSGKLVAAVCHGTRLLAMAGVASSLKLTSWPDLQQELEQAGARWVDQPVVEDGMFITSQHPADLDDFSRTLLSRLSDEVQSAPASLHF